MSELSGFGPEYLLAANQLGEQSPNYAADLTICRGNGADTPGFGDDNAAPITSSDSRSHTVFETAQQPEGMGEAPAHEGGVRSITPPGFDQMIVFETAESAGEEEVGSQVGGLPDGALTRENVKVSESVRRPGVLERADPSIEPLPPTPINDEARQRLQEWGVPDEMVGELQEFTSSMRYDLTVQKAERIAEKGIYIYRHSNDGETVVLPDFHDFNDRGDGQCIDLSVQLSNLLADSGYMDKINTHAAQRGKPPMRLVLGVGLSRTHFSKAEDGARHVWLGLTSGQDIEDMVTVDPSFQEISHIDSNAYTTQRIVDGPMRHSNTLTRKVGRQREIEGDSRGEQYPIILGSSTDKTLVYMIGFSKNVETSTYHPSVLPLLPNGSTGMGRIMLSDGELKAFGEPQYPQISDTHWQEMGAIVQALARAPIIKNQRQAKLLINQEAMV